MSCFSRGCLRKPQFLPYSTKIYAFFIPKPISQQRRLYSPSFLRLQKQSSSKRLGLQTPKSISEKNKSRTAQSTSSKVPPQRKPPGAHPTRLLDTLPVYEYHKTPTYANTLARKDQPTILYKAPSHLPYFLACYGGSLTLLAYASFVPWRTWFNPPSGISSWVPTAFLGIGIFVASFALWMGHGPARIVKMVSVIPQKAAGGIGVEAGLAARKGQAATLQQQKNVPPYMVEVEIKRMVDLPFLKPKRLLVKPDDVVLNKLIALPGLERGVFDRRKPKMGEQPGERRITDQGRSLTAMLRSFGQHLKGFLRVMVRAWTRDGFVDFLVEGKKYRLDMKNAYMLDDGVPLDTLFSSKYLN